MCSEATVGLGDILPDSGFERRRPSIYSPSKPPSQISPCLHSITIY